LSSQKGAAENVQKDNAVQMPCAFRFAIKTTNNAARSGTGSGVSTGGPSAPHPPHHRFGILRYPQDFSLCGFPTIASISIRFSFVAGLLHFSHALGMSQKLKLNARGWPIRLKLITLSPQAQMPGDIFTK